MEDLTLEELQEIKMCLNEMMGARISYSFTETKPLLLAENQRYLNLDRRLLEKTIKQINRLKEIEKC